MDNKIKESLRKEIEELSKKISGLTVGSKEHTDAVESLSKLYKMAIEEEKNENEAASKKAELSEAKKDRYVKIAFGAAKVVGYSAFFIIGLNFEKSGNLCSNVFKNLWGTFKPDIR